MKLKQLVSIRDTMKIILKEYGEQLTNVTKVDFDDTIDVFSNIIDDAEKERRLSLPTRDHIMYHIRIDLR